MLLFVIAAASLVQSVTCPSEIVHCMKNNMAILGRSLASLDFPFSKDSAGSLDAYLQSLMISYPTSNTVAFV